MWSVTVYPDGSLVLLTDPEGDDDAPMLPCYVVPAGPLALQLSTAMRTGELWTLTLAADGATVIAARYGEGT